MLFAKPESFYWLLILLPPGAAWLSYFLWKRRVVAQIGHQPLVAAMSARFSSGRALAQTLLFFGALILCVIALAQPQWGMSEREIKRMGVDVVFALDLSNSMLAEDAAPNRLKAAADEIRTVMSRLDGDRVGLVIFTSLSFPQSPLTTDYAAISFFLSKLHPDQIPVGGTSVGSATRESIELLLGKKLNDQNTESSAMRRAKNQVIVLVTDGEDHESDPLATADFAAQHGIRLVTVGIGNPNGTQIPTFDKNGRKTGVMRDESGAPIVTRLDDSTLKQMAQRAGGIYLGFTGKNSVANGIVNYLNELEKTELDSLMRQRYEDRFMFFLAPALLMLLASFGIGQRRKNPKKPATTVPRKTSTSNVLAIFSLMFIATFATGCDDAFRSTIDEIDTANGLLSAGRFDDAVAAYQQAEPLVGNTDEYQYNLGRAYLSTGDFAQAQSHLARALATDDTSLKFDVLYNLGLALAGQDLWQQAYETFKQTLLLSTDDPQLYESERYQNARHNLELAFRKLFPPCSELEDDLEPNDSISQASKLENMKAEARTLCGMNDDWFAIPASPGSQVKVTAKFKALRETPDPEHVFLPRPEDLQLILFDDRGGEAVSIDQGLPLDSPAKLAQINKQHLTQRTLDTLLVTPDMLQTGQNHLYLKVAAAEGLEFKYDLEIEVIPPCYELDDKFEPNDLAAQATAITPGNHPIHICKGNEDWFRLDVQPGDSFFVDVQAGEDVEKKTAPELALEIIDAKTQQPVATGRTEGGYITAGLQNIPRSGQYLIRIRGVDNEQQGPVSFDLHLFEPCPVGEDRYAPNHAAQQPAELDPNQPAHRYLRICPENPDHFLAPVGEDKSIELGLMAVSPDSAILDLSNAEAPAFELDLLSQTDGSVLTSAVRPEPAPQDDDATQPEAAAMAFDRVLVHPDITEEKALIRVTGTPGFYHLVALNPPDSDQQDDQNQDDQEQQEDKEDDEEKSEDEKSEDEKSEDEKSEDEKSEDEKSEDEKSEDEKSEDEKSEDEKSEDEKSQDGDDPSDQKPEEPAEPEDAEKAAANEQSEQEINAQHVQDILQALEDADDNFQMQKALENMPARLIEKNW